MRPLTESAERRRTPIVSLPAFSCRARRRESLLDGRPVRELPAASTKLYRYSPKWALGLLGAALILVIIVGMIRDVTERWRQRFDGG
jgi:hypothetical protein